MTKNELAVLANLYGVDETASLLQTDKKTVERGISGQGLTRLEKADLDIAFAQLEKKYLQGEIDFDLAEVEQESEVLMDSQNLLNDYNLSSKLTEAYARNQITNSQLNDLYSLWGNLTPSQSTKILDYLDEDKTRNASLITQLYLEEEDLFGNYTESEFWTWYRDNFGDVSP